MIDEEIFERFCIMTENRDVSDEQALSRLMREFGRERVVELWAKILGGKKKFDYKPQPVQ